MMFCLPAILDQIIDDGNYCPLDIAGFYFIDFEIILKNDSSGYCPLDTTGFYDFAQAP